MSVPLPFRRNDTDLAHHIVNAITWDIEVPSDRVKVKVDKGWVTLEGQVDWQYERNAAERAVRYITGVHGVINLLTLKPARLGEGRRLQDQGRARPQAAETDSKKIVVSALDGKVTLTGTVRSWSERADAERAAWSALGVNKVEDRLAVTF